MHRIVTIVLIALAAALGLAACGDSDARPHADSGAVALAAATKVDAILHRLERWPDVARA